MNYFRRFVTTALWLLTLPLAAEETQRGTPAIPSPLSAEDSLRHLVLADDNLTVELAACEPEVIDPVAIKFDEDGRMWVAEMHDYPLGAIRQSGGKRTEKDAEPMSRIKILEDADGDGRFEKATVFADKLSFVTGIQPWKGGAIVTLAGRVAYMKDTDGDGKADLDETWFTGFAEQNSQLRANHPTFALDNWVYVANGLRGGKVVNHLRKIREQGTGDRGQEASPKSQIPSPKSEIANLKSEISLSGMDFRFNPLTGEAEAVSGNGQFGLTFDDWGNRFICSNRNPCMHVVIENRYLKRAPNVAIPAVVQDVAAAAENSRIYPLTRAWTTSNLHAGQFTAACGVFIYRGDLLPKLRGNVFSCDPTGNLVHREIMKEKGPTFESKPAYEGKEFLASRDEWFRPVSMQLGPDGALYVVDMYRAVIEHPEWVPDELKNRPDERLGDDRGRIYRIVPKAGMAKDTNPKRQRGAFPKLSALPSADLVKLLEHDSAWQRDTAQRLLVERQEAGVTESVGQLVAGDYKPHVKLTAIATLVGLGRADKSHFVIALKTNHAHLQDAAIGLLDAAKVPPDRRRPLLAVVGFRSLPPWTQIRAGLLNDDHGQNEFLQVSTPVDAEDPWLRRLFLLNVRKAGLIDGGMLPMVGARTSAERAFASEWVEAAIAVGGSKRGEAMLQILLPKDDQEPITLERVFQLTALAESLKRHRYSLTNVAEPIPELKLRLEILQKHVTAQAENELRQHDIRAKFIQLLGYLPESAELVAAIATREDTDELRLAAVGALAKHDPVAPWQTLVARLPSEPPSLRSAIFDGIFQRPERIALLLDAIESGTIQPEEIDRVQTDRLLKHGDAKIRQRAAKIFGAATPADRQKALEDYQSVLAMNADALRGRKVFEKNCATCHKIGDLGVNVAPDISDSRTKTPAQILGDIIQPNRAIDANYIAWNVLLNDGSSASGVLSAETGTSITLRQPEGKTLVVSRSDIEQLKSTGLSLMPEGLEKNIPHQEMADLIGFIKNWRYLDGRTPVNK